MQRLIGFIVISLMLGQFAFAQLPLIQKSCTPEGLTDVEADSCEWADFIVAVRRFIALIVNGSFFVALLLVLYGGLLVMTGGPSPANVGRGYGIIQTALIGYILVLVSGFLIDLVLGIFQPQFNIPSIKTIAPIEK